MPDRPPNPAARAARSWLIGLPLLIPVWGAVTLFAAPRAEQALARQAASVVAGTATPGAEPWLRVTAQGRDLVAAGEAPDAAARDTALARLAEIAGPRHLVADLGLVSIVSPFVWTATQPDATHLRLDGVRPTEIGRQALAERVAAAAAPGLAIEDTARSASGAPPGFLAAAVFAVERLRALRPGATVTIRDTTVTFAGEAADVESYDALRTALANPPEGFALARTEILPPVVAEFHMAVARKAEGGLLLSGFVPSESVRASMLAAATEASEGGTVDDRMRTARGLAAGIDAAGLPATLVRLASLLHAGEVRLDGARLAVTGTAIDGQAVAEIAALVKDARPAGIEAGPVTVTGRAVAPYRVAIRRDEDVLLLSGHLPDAAMRDRLLARIRTRFFRERVVDRLRLADGAPAGLAETLDAAMPALATLARGEIAIADASLALTGESLYPESARRLSETLPRAAGPGWSARVAIATPGTAPDADPATCRTRLAQISASPLHFAPGSATLNAAFYPVLDSLAVLARTCPTLRIAVSGHPDPASNAPARIVLEGIAPTDPIAEAAKVEPSKVEPAKPDAARSPEPGLAEGSQTASPSGPAQPAGQAAEGAKPGPNPDAKHGKAADPGQAAEKAKVTEKAGAGEKAKASEKAKGAEGAEKAKVSDKAKAAEKAKAADKAKAEAAAKAAAKARADAEAARLELPRTRAQAVVEYLLQAGARPEQVSVAASDERAAPATIAFAERP